MLNILPTYDEMGGRGEDKLINTNEKHELYDEQTWDEEIYKEMIQIQYNYPQDEEDILGI